MWLALASCHHRDPDHTCHHVGNFLVDNTLAILWLIHAGCAKSPHLCCLACFLQAILTLSPIHLQFQSHHISGMSNEMVDILLHPSCTKLWAYAINMHPNGLQNCMPYLMPCKLLMALHGCIISNAIEATSIARMTVQWTPELHTLPPGWEQWGATIGLYN